MCLKKVTCKRTGKGDKAAEAAGTRMRETDEFAKKAAAMRRSGKSLREISQKLCRSRSYISRVLSQNGCRKYTDHDTNDREYNLCNLKFAEEKKPIAEKVVINGKSYMDVTELYVPQ